MFTIQLGRGPSAPRAASVGQAVALRFYSGRKMDAFTEIYNRFRAPLFSFLLKRVESITAVEDLAHDIFLKILRSRGLYNPALDFAPWFWTVARNSLNDHLRHRLTGGTSVPFEGPNAEEDGTAALIATADIETLVIRHSDRTVLLKFLDQLTRLQREALSLRLVHRLSYREIARKMSLSLSAVKSLIHRAQRSLKQSFKGEP